MKEKTKLVLLIGSGRSGSTLIDLIVNMHPKVLGLGEISNWNTKVFLKNTVLVEKLLSPVHSGLR